MKKTFLFVAFAALALVCQSQAKIRMPDVTGDYKIQTIDVPAPSGGVINAIYCVFINEAGMMVVQYNSVISTTGGGIQSEGQTAVREKGVWTVINVPNSAWTGCGNPTASGQVPLCYADAAGNWHNAIWHHGRYTYLPDCQPPYQCGAQLINDRGIMTGIAFDPTGTFWDPVNSWYGVHGVLFNASLSLFKMFDYPSAYSTYPMGINDDGQIVGNYTSSEDYGFHCFFSDRGNTFVNIDPPDSTNPVGVQTMAVWFINNHREIVGHYTEASTGVQEGFLLREGKYFTFNVPQSTSTDINCILDDGKLSGVYVDTETPSMQHAFIATPKCLRH